MKGAEVFWTCRKQAHREAPPRAGRGGLTVYKGQWAYCDGDVEDTAHEWTPTGGVTIDLLIDWPRALAPRRGQSVHR